MKHGFDHLAHPKAGIPAVQYIYRDANGAPVLIANRYDKPDRSKFFLPYDVMQNVWKAPDVRPLYNLNRITSADPQKPVLFVEGEKCADALATLGYLTMTIFGGSNALAKANLMPLMGRKILIWPDFDKAGQAYALDAAERLTSGHKATVKLVPISQTTLQNVVKCGNSGQYEAKWDAADAISEGWSRDNIQTLLALSVPYVSKGYKKSKPYADPLDTIKLWHTPDEETFATLHISGHSEHWPLDSTNFKNFLTYHHYQAERKMLSQAALEDKRRTLAGEALFAGEKHKVFTRLGHFNDTLYLDLGDSNWRSVAINAVGWKVLDQGAARFQRSRSMQTLPMPESGDINLLRPFLNVASDTDFKMLVAWLLGCFQPSGPYPILILTGEQGSAKSTAAKVLRSLIDPTSPMTRSAPHTEQDLVIAAKHNHILAFDNLSHIKPALADALCRISTGGGFGTRKLHTNSEEVLFDATRPCLLNGIPDLASRPDLADRSIIVTLPVISENDRQFDSVFWKKFDYAAPKILGALLSAVSTALARQDAITLETRPRMADFAKWVTAAEPALGWQDGEFSEAYSQNRQSVEEAAIEGNPVAEAILCLVADRGQWQGTATELMKTLRINYPILTDDPLSFPRQPNKLSSELKRVQPLLRRQGLVIGFERHGKTGQRLLSLKSA